MSGRGPRGPGFGYGPYTDPSGVATTTANASNGTSSSSNNLPVWALVLIMVGSGLVTLTFLWLCVLFVCRKRRRARQAAVRDLETEQQVPAWESSTARMLGNHATLGEKELADLHARRCENAGVELTFVVMAGEEQPSYLARPAPSAPEEENSSENSKQSADLKPASSPPPVQVALANAEQPQNVSENHHHHHHHHPKTPPSPS